jgi:peroxiredoxin
LAPDFRLPDPQGRQLSRSDCRGERGTLVVFMCNHCPYVQAIHARLVADARALLPLGVKTVAIMSNDYRQYPEDAPARMAETITLWDLPFPYLVDEAQTVARACGAVCTPDFFGYNADLKLQYRGRLDAGSTSPPPPGCKRELLDAMRQVAETGIGPQAQIPSMGCSIKWRS